jgi:hypothetical protein
MPSDFEASIRKANLTADQALGIDGSDASAPDSNRVLPKPIFPLAQSCHPLWISALSADDRLRASDGAVREDSVDSRDAQALGRRRVKLAMTS